MGRLKDLGWHCMGVHGCWVRVKGEAVRLSVYERDECQGIVGNWRKVLEMGVGGHGDGEGGVGGDRDSVGG